MTISVAMVTFDTTDARSLATWWARQTGGRALDGFEDDYIVVEPGGQGPRLGFQQVADPTPGKNRLHLDVEADDRELEVDRLLGEGAAMVARHEAAGFTWVVLADPHGNQFCVSQRH